MGSEVQTNVPYPQCIVSFKFVFLVTMITTTRNPRFYPGTRMHFFFFYNLRSSAQEQLGRLVLCTDAHRSICCYWSLTSQ